MCEKVWVWEGESCVKAGETYELEALIGGSLALASGEPAAALASLEPPIWLTAQDPYVPSTARAMCSLRIFRPVVQFSTNAIAQRVAQWSK